MAGARRGLLLLTCLGACGAPAAKPTPIPADASQLIVVSAPSWDETHATLRRYERAGGRWRSVGEAVPVVLGRSGLAWGRGLHGTGAPAGRAGPVKGEGDGKSTAGAFRLGGLFGRDAVAPAGTRGAYTPLAETWRCVDDPASRHYNQVLDGARVEPDWKSAEDMWGIGAPYDLVIVIDHNTPPVARGGSCIFLHVWRDAEAPTAGCTAMPKSSLAELMAWLVPDRAIYVALPNAELEALRERWRLP